MVTSKRVPTGIGVDAEAGRQVAVDGWVRTEPFENGNRQWTVRAGLCEQGSSLIRVRLVRPKRHAAAQERVAHGLSVGIPALADDLDRLELWAMHVIPLLEVRRHLAVEGFVGIAPRLGRDTVKVATSGRAQDRFARRVELAPA